MADARRANLSQGSAGQNRTRNLVFSDAESLGARGGVWPPEEYSLKLLLEPNMLVGAVVFAKELWLRTGGCKRALPWSAEDYSFWLGCAAVGLSPHRIEGALFKHRQQIEPFLRALMMQRRPTVEAMVLTLHSYWYDDAALPITHERIGRIDDETLAVLVDKEPRLNGRAFPKLCFGLNFELVEG